LIIAMLTRIRWNLNVVLICISFMTKDIEHSSIICCPFVLLLLRIVCSVHLPIYSMFGDSLRG
jgi:hypothetical protein